MNDVINPQSVLSPHRIIFLEHTGKKDVLQKLANNLAKEPQIKDKKELSDEILKREALMSTAIGCGIAIPHVRLSSVTDLVISVGISKVDIIDFNPLDDEPVRLVFMIASSNTQHKYYLQTLSYFSKKLKDKELRESLLKAQTTEEVYNLLIK